MARFGVRGNACCFWIFAITFFNCFAVLAAAQHDPGIPAGKYNGPGSCAASACHGGAQIMDIKTRANTRTHIWQNEYFIWATQDPHFKSYSTLKTERSRQISKLLGRPKLPAEDENCLGCHALKPPPNLQAREFAPEGVSCESCHEPSSGWFEKHFLLKSNTKESIQYGMYAIRDAERRSVRCLTCHVGTGKYEVDHQMIAAGHPDLFFELDLFSAKEPRHWPTPSELHTDFKDVPDDPNYEVRLWAVGQAVQLREALNRLTRRADRGRQLDAAGEHARWPELSELDCFSCHHSVNSNWRDPEYDERAARSHPQGFDSWRQNHGYKDTTPGYGDRTPGSPPWNSAHYTIFRILLKAIDPVDSANLDMKLQELYRLASKLNSSPDKVFKQAGDASDLAAHLVEKIAGKFPYPPNASSLDKNLLLSVMLEISAEGDHIAYQDTRSAEQAYMAMESLFRSYDGIKSGAPLKSGEHSSAGQAINDLYVEFDNPSAYNAPRFADKMHKINLALGGKNIAAKRPLKGGITRKLQVRQPHSAN